MIRHVILWQLKEEYDAKKREEILVGIKTGLEGLAGQIPGLLKIRVITQGLASSSADAMLDAQFEDEAALAGYRTHPAHAAVADTFVRPFVKTRVCMDSEPDDGDDTEDGYDGYDGYGRYDRQNMYDGARMLSASENGVQLAYTEGLAAGRNLQLKDMIRRKLAQRKTSAEIAEELGEDLLDIEMLIVQLLERC